MTETHVDIYSSLYVTPFLFPSMTAVTVPNTKVLISKHCVITFKSI